MYAGGTEGTLISRPVEDWLNVVVNAEEVTGGYHRLYFVFLGGVQHLYVFLSLLLLTFRKRHIPFFSQYIL